MGVKGPKNVPEVSFEKLAPMRHAALLEKKPILPVLNSLLFCRGAFIRGAA